MKKLLAIIAFALVVYYFVFSNNSRVEKTKTTKQLPAEERVFDYDTQYKDAVKDINEAVDTNLEKIKSVEEMLDDVNSETEEADPPE